MKTLGHYAESMWLFPFWLDKPGEGPKRIREDGRFIYLKSAIPRPYIEDMVMNPECPKKYLRTTETGERVLDEKNVALDWPGYEPWSNKDELHEVESHFSLGMVFLPIYYNRRALKQAVKEGEPAFIFTPVDPVLIEQDRSYLYYMVRVPKIFYNQYRNFYDDPLYQVPKPQVRGIRRVLKEGVKKEEATDADYEYFPIIDYVDPMRMNLDAMHPTPEDEKRIEEIFDKIKAEDKITASADKKEAELWSITLECERCQYQINIITFDPFGELLYRQCDNIIDSVISIKCGCKRFRIKLLEKVKS